MSPRIKEHTMNRNQVKGAAKDVAGKIQQKVGELTGNKTQQAKGAAKQVEGKVQKGVGNVEQAFDKANRKPR
jgi:uncharacterized protein YjbJ (UPF0337 family)